MLEQTTPLTLLYTAALVGQLELLPRLFTRIEREQAAVGGDALLVDLGQSCRAGAYVCPLVEDTPPGGACACPGHGGQRIRGRAD